MELTPEQTDTLLTWLTWGGGALAALWAVTSVVAHLHRRAYNLTHAESGRSQNITPDFLDVDVAKRRAAIARGQAYDDTLRAREAAAAAAVSPAEQVSGFARIGALATALLTLVVTIFGTVTKVEAIEAGMERVGSIDQFVDLVTQHKAGAAVALAVIGTHLVLFVRSSKKTLAGK